MEDEKPPLDGEGQSEDAAGRLDNVEVSVPPSDVEQVKERAAVPQSEVLTKVCANCSTQTQTAGTYCPNCGKAFVRVRPWSSGRFRVALFVTASVLVLGCGAIVVNQVVAHNTEVAAQDEAQRVADVQATKAAEAARAKTAEDSAERASRAIAVTGVEASITTDAQQQVTEGTLDGPIIKSSCTPLGGGSTDDLTAITTTFSCIAVNVENADGTSRGYRFSATVNWNDGSYSWHLGD